MKNNFPQRKRTRLSEFDYNTPEKYFVTFCVDKRKNILSKIVGEGSSLPLLTSYGKAVDKLIGEIPGKYPGIGVEAYVIMPNHVHLLLSVSESDGWGNPTPTIDQVIGWLKFHATKKINELRQSPFERVFQRSFHDHIIRGQNDYEEIFHYINDNPCRWKADKFFAAE